MQQAVCIAGRLDVGRLRALRVAHDDVRRAVRQEGVGLAGALHAGSGKYRGQASIAIRRMLCLMNVNGVRGRPRLGYSQLPVQQRD
jgi:hypothetical protein